VNKTWVGSTCGSSLALSRRHRSRDGRRSLSATSSAERATQFSWANFSFSCHTPFTSTDANAADEMVIVYLFRECCSRCRFQPYRPMTASSSASWSIDSVRLQILLMGTCRQCGSWSVAGHNHRNVIGRDHYVKRWLGNTEGSHAETKTAWGTCCLDWRIRK